MNAVATLTHILNDYMDLHRLSPGGSSGPDSLSSKGPSPTTLQLPVFHRRKPKTFSEYGLLFEEVHETLLQNYKRREILDSECLDRLWHLLNDSQLAIPEDKRRISYSEFKHIKQQMGQNFENYFKTSIFARFKRDEKARISALQFFNYVLRRVSLMQASLDLKLYDSDKDGLLTEEELQNYILDMMPILNLNSLNPAFYKFYVCTAIKKFMFFLDPTKRGKISIQNILLSPILTELFELRDVNLSKEEEKTNWFSAHSSLRVYSQFLALDSDQNGMLSKDELMNFNGGTLTGVFLERVFQECLSFGGELDYRAYLDFVLAIENLNTPQGIAYCFKLLDFQGKRYLDELTITYFVRAVIDKMSQFSLEPISLDDVINEVFDMACPKKPDRIDLNDLIDSGMGGTIIGIMIDCHGIHEYDAREIR